MDQAPSIAEESALLLDEFALFEEQRDKVEYILDLGKQLPPLAEQHKTEANKVRGCQSQVWARGAAGGGSCPPDRRQ